MLNSYGPALPGVKRGTLRGPMARGVSGFMKALERHRVVADTGDYGSAMVYRDDAGDYRCKYMVRWSEVDASTLKTKTAVRAWLKVWLPKQRYLES